MPLALIVHGGAGDVPRADWPDHLQGVKHAAASGWQVLLTSGSALDAVETAITLMEDTPCFDAGVGSVLNRDGIVEMDAGIMDGNGLHAGACAAVTRVRNPIRLARAILNSENTFMVAEGAERFALSRGLDFAAPQSFITPAEMERWRRFLVQPPPAEEYYGGGTVGCVAVDRDGNVVAGTSTGGRDFKMPGRVGDSPLIGSGFYADNDGGGASTTGWGEGISRLVLCKWCVDELVRGGAPDEIARAAILQLQTRVQGRGGVILADRWGRVGTWHNTRTMARAWITGEHPQVIARIE